MGRRKESGVPLMEWQDGEYYHAGAGESSASDSSGRRPSMMPAVWTVGVVLACLGLAAALTLAVMTFERFDTYRGHQNVNRICNRGENTGLGLEDCPDVGGVPGFPLLSASDGTPGNIYASRVSRGDGVLLTETPDSHIEVSANIESLTPAILVGVSPSPVRAITLDIDLPAINITLCNITCTENFFLNLPNGDVGYGLAMGTDHTFANDATHAASAILSGRNNVMVASNGSVVVGGQNNTISDTAWSLVGAGHDNSVTSPRSAVVAGGFNIVQSALSFVGAGENNQILSLYEANAIVSGDSNELLNCTRSIIGTGFDNVMRDSEDCAVVSGKENQILDSVTSIVGAGADNVIDTCVASSILSGHNNTVAQSSHSTIGGGESNLVNVTTGSVISAGFDNEISGQSYHCGIVTGSTCTITASNTSLVGAGSGNVIDQSVSSSVTSGRNNEIHGCNRTGIVAGDGNYIENTDNAFIGGGIGNYINFSRHSTIVAGSANIIDAGNVAGASSNFIGAGTLNEITREDIITYDLQYNFIGAGQSVIRDSYSCAMVAGAGNTVNVSSTSVVIAGQFALLENQRYSLIGTGTLNTIIADTQGNGNAIIAGSANEIRGDIDYSFVGAGDNNIVRTLSGTTSGVFVGSGFDNIITDSWRSGIIAGSSSTVASSNSSLIGVGTDNGISDTNNAVIGAGHLNTITQSPNSAIVAGYLNTISPALTSGNGGNFIGAGFLSEIRDQGVGTYDVQYNFIGAGGSSIYDSETCIIGAGIDNIVDTCAACGVLAGQHVTITDSTYTGVLAGRFIDVTDQAFSFVGAGTLHEMSSEFLGQGNAIVAGFTNSITGNTNYSFIGTASNSIVRALPGQTNIAGFIGAGINNVITSSTRTAIVVGAASTITNSLDCFMGAANSSSIADSDHSAIGASYNVAISNSDGAFAGGVNNVITNADYAFIAGGRDIVASGSLDASTGHMRHARVLETFRTPGIEVITGDVTVALGDHLFLANGVAAIINLGVAATTPDGMQIRVRDVGDVSMANVVLSCVTSGCTICPPNAACTIGGTDTMNVQYATRFYVFRATANTWYAY